MTSASDLHQSILKMLSFRDVSFEEARPTLDVLFKEGHLDPRFTVETITHQKIAFGAELMSTWSDKKYRGPRTKEDFELIDQWLGCKDWGLWEVRRGKPLFELWLNEGRATSDLEKVSPEFLERAPINALLTWEAPLRGAQQAILNPPGYDLLVNLLDRKANEIIARLFERGLSATVCSAEGRPAALNFRTPDQWDAFLEQGGDPNMRVLQNYGPNEGEPCRLWEEMLRLKRNTELKTHIEKRLLESGQAGEMEEELKKQFMQQVAGNNAPSDLAKFVRSRKDWAEIHDPDGCNVLFLVAKRGQFHATTFTQLASPAKAKPLLHETDHQGRGLWLYAWLESGEGSHRVFNLLRDEKVKPCQDKDGRGLLLQYKHFGNKSRSLIFAGDHLKLPPESKRSAFNDAQLWLAGPEQEQKNLREELYEVLQENLETGKSHGENTWSAIVECLAASPDHRLSPQWRTFFLLRVLTFSDQKGVKARAAFNEKALGKAVDLSEVNPQLLKLVQERYPDEWQEIHLAETARVRKLEAEQGETSSSRVASRRPRP